MQSALHLTTRVLPGNRIEVAVPELKVGDPVEVFLVARPIPAGPGDSALEIIESLGGHRLFSTTEEVDRYVQEERDEWRP
jgi:hypothetical protein